MNTIEIILSLFVVVAAMAWIAAKLKVPYPIFLVLGGLVLSLLPRLPKVHLAPDVVFLVFLPPILYQAGVLTSWRDFKANRRAIGFLAFGLVLFTTAAIAVIAHYLMGMSWAAGFVLGAIVSPPDAVAATAIMSRMRIPKRVIVILEGESLVNDATALVAYKFAIAAVILGTFSITQAAGKLIVLGVGGVAFGLLIGYVIAWIRPRIKDDGVEAMVSLLTPYIIYIPAEHLGVSGVLATVAAGLYIGRRMTEITTGRSRLRLYSLWDIVIYLLNGLVFILIGLQLPTVVNRLQQTGHLLRDGILISLAVVLIRMIYVFPAAFVMRAVRRRKVPLGIIFIIGWTGMRGIVSLAAALALPMTLRDGVTPFPHRDLILFVTFVVILFTLVVQGISLPGLIKRLRLGEDGIEQKEELQARYEAVNAALARMEALVFLGEARLEIVDRVRADYQFLARALHHQLKGGLDAEADKFIKCRTTEAVMQEAIIAQRAMLVKLRNDGVISDEVLRRILTELDLEESRLGSAALH